MTAAGAPLLPQPQPHLRPPARMLLSPRDWRQALRQPHVYRVGSSSLRVQSHLLVFLLLLFVVCFGYFGQPVLRALLCGSGSPASPASSSSASSPASAGEQRASCQLYFYNRTYPLTPPTRGYTGVTYNVALVADLDTDSRVVGAKNQWRSYLLKGRLTHMASRSLVSVEWDDGPVALTGSLALKGRGMELSELVVFDGRLLTFDDRTGMVYFFDADNVYPWVILMDGNGKSSKGFKSEWATVKDEQLYVGSMGKEWTTPSGEFVHNDPQWIKIVSPHGEVHSNNWISNYKRLREAIGIQYPGYMIHESGAWSNVHHKWFFLPRRCSKEQYNETKDEMMSCNVLLTADESFIDIQVTYIGKVVPIRGFSSFKFLPGSDDSIIVALKTEEFQGNTATYITAFTIEGQILMPDLKVSDKKYEVICRDGPSVAVSRRSHLDPAVRKSSRFLGPIERYHCNVDSPRDECLQQLRSTFRVNPNQQEVAASEQCISGSGFASKWPGEAVSAPRERRTSRASSCKLSGDACRCPRAVQRVVAARARLRAVCPARFCHARFVDGSRRDRSACSAPASAPAASNPSCGRAAAHQSQRRERSVVTIAPGMAGSKSAEADWSKARRGISLLLNNQTQEAETLFSQDPSSLHMKAGRSFVLFMNALMTFEEDKLEQAVQALRDAERESAPDTGWIRSMRNRMFGPDDTHEEHVARLERQVVLADSQVCAALITMLQQEMSSYVRAGWSLRKAWRVYQQAYNEILQLHRRTFGQSPSGLHSLCGTPCGDPTSPSSPTSPVWPSSFAGATATTTTDWRSERVGCNGPTERISSAPQSAAPTPSPSGLRSSLSMLFSLAGITSEQQTPFVEPSEVARLMSAVSFGYGLFQLSVSLLPPSLLRVIHFLGFEGDRQVGLAALMYARLGEDMRAPLATLALLWYHTIVRPFFALDGANVRAGVEAAKLLIAESQPEFANSAVFLFFIGRIERLQSNVIGALRAYERAVEVSAQREVRLLCLHEVAWCHLIRLRFGDARASLAKLQNESRWSKSFYAYLAALCSGAEGDFEELLSTSKRLVHFMTASTTDTQLSLFISKRSPKLIDQEYERAHPNSYYKLLVYELLYLWNALPSCSVESLRNISIECKSSQSEEPMHGLSDLIEGATYSFLGDREAAIRCYRNCLKRRLPSKDSFDQHISAFALYELGCTLCYVNNVEEGRCILQRALSQYKDYDFESRLTVRIHAALKKIS